MFVPPRHERVEPAIADLVAFLRRDDLPVLPQAALAHAQFETIHPFIDGNGRTGRALVHSMLRNRALTRGVTVPVSAGLLADTGAYFEALTAYRDGDLTPITRQVSQAVFAGLTHGRQLLGDLRSIQEGWDERLRARQDSGVWRVADLLLRHPVVNARLVADELDVVQTNIYRFLNQMEQAGVLIESTDRRRNRVWRSPEVLAALDGFAARARRRS